MRAEYNNNMYGESFHNLFMFPMAAQYRNASYNLFEFNKKNFLAERRQYFF